VLVSVSALEQSYGLWRGEMRKHTKLGTWNAIVTPCSCPVQYLFSGSLQVKPSVKASADQESKSHGTVGVAVAARWSENPDPGN
jgi:hypothetical protein